MLSSLATYLEPLPDEEGDSFLTQIQALFQSDFITKQHEAVKSAPVDLDDLPDHLSSEERHQAGDYDQDTARDNCGHPTTQSTSQTNSNTVLHLGSVLSTEHDYLL